MKVRDHVEGWAFNGRANNKQQLRIVISEHVAFFRQTLNNGQWMDLVNSAMNIRIPWSVSIFAMNQMLHESDLKNCLPPTERYLLEIQYPSFRVSLTRKANSTTLSSDLKITKHTVVQGLKEWYSWRIAKP
jgi:hypothetical protein